MTVPHKTFTPFGAEHAAVGALLSERTYYAGHRRHDDTGLYYMQARWMDPNAGTFLGIDPLVPSAADPQSHNSYAYARNDPVVYADPDGRCVTVFTCTGLMESDGFSRPSGQTFTLTTTYITTLGDDVTVDVEKVTSSPYGTSWGFASGVFSLSELRKAAEAGGGSGADGGGSGSSPQNGGTDDLMSPSIENVNRGIGPNTRGFMAGSGSRAALGDAVGKLSKESGDFPKFSTIATAIVPGEQMTPASTATAETGLVRNASVIGGISTAADAGAKAIVIRLPYTMDNTPVSRGGYVGQALHVSRINGGLPVFLQAPRGTFGSLLAVEFTGTRMSPAGLIAPVSFR